MGRYWNMTKEEYYQLEEEVDIAIREYECKNPDKGCDRCLSGFELQQRMTDDLINKCPYCGTAVRQIISMSSFQLTGEGWTRRGA